MLEQWRTAIVNGEPWENYEVSNLGRIMSLNYNRTGRAELMNPEETNFGYFRVTLCKNKETKHCFVHRLVGEAFLPNPENKPFINHKIQGDEGKKINIVYIEEDGSINKEKSTIEWVTAKENNNYATRNERIAKKMTNGKKSKKVLQFTLDGEFIREWPSTAECGRNGFCESYIAACCRGEYKQAYGYKWEYA